MVSESAEKSVFSHIKLYSFEKKDILPCIIITLVYASIAFFNLGEIDSIQSYTRIYEGDIINFFLEEPVDISEVRYYAGIRSGTFTLEYSLDKKHWESVSLEQDLGQTLRWHSLSETDENDNTVYTSLTAQYFRLKAIPDENEDHPTFDFMELGELALFNTNGELITIQTVDEEGIALFDEQDHVDIEYWTNSTYFDEIYYATSAREYLTGDFPDEITHPPLGKLIIAIGVQFFGLNPFGWRFMGALFGVLMLPILYLLLKNMLGKTIIATCGMTLFATEFMHLTQTRIATIDTYGVFFILAMYYFFYRWLATPAEAGLRKSILPLFLSGLMFGIGTACKWIVLYGGAGLAVLWLIGIVSKVKDLRKTSNSDANKYLLGTIGLSIIFFIFVPIIIYCLSYIPYVIADGCKSLPEALRCIWSAQKDMLTFHQAQQIDHPYESKWYEWLIDASPIRYYPLDTTPTVNRVSFGAFNSPLISWTGLISIVMVGIEHLNRKSQCALFVLVGYFAQLLPWIIISRSTFSYHYFPSILFCVLAICFLMNSMFERNWRKSKAIALGFTSYAVFLFIAFYPVLVGISIPDWYSNVILWYPGWKSALFTFEVFS